LPNIGEKPTSENLADSRLLKSSCSTMGDEFITLKHMAQQNLSSIVAKQLQHTKLAIPDSQKQRVARLVDSHLRQHYSLMMKKLGLKKLVPY